MYPSPPPHPTTCLSSASATRASHLSLMWCHPPSAKATAGSLSVYPSGVCHMSYTGPAVVRRPTSVTVLSSVCLSVHLTLSFPTPSTHGLCSHSNWPAAGGTHTASFSLWLPRSFLGGRWTALTLSDSWIYCASFYCVLLPSPCHFLPFPHPGASAPALLSVWNTVFPPDLCLFLKSLLK